MDLMRIGSSALGAAYAQLQTTGQNIANASTPGYVRREVGLRETGYTTGAGWVGSGVGVSEIRRVYDQFLARESQSSRAASAQDAARSEGLQRLDRLFADPETGLGASFDALVDAFGEVAARPSDPSARSVVLNRVDAFATRARTIDERLVELREATQARMRNEAGRANDMLRALADVNARLRAQQSAGGAPNGVLDDRDRLVAELNAVLRANASFAEDGTVSLTTARGEPLVTGVVAARLVLSPDGLDASKLGLSIVRGNNGGTVPVASDEVGGSLGGMLRFAGQDVDAARAQLGRIVAAAALEIDARQTRGLDATGARGQALFGLGPIVATPAAGNAGTATLDVTVADPKGLRATDYAVGFDGAQYTVTRLADGSVESFGSLPQTLDGLNFDLASGAPAAGDRILVRSATAFAAGARALQTNPARIATAMPVTVEKGAANAGDANVEALTINSIGPNTAQPVTLTFTSAGTFNVSGTGTGNPSGLIYGPGMTLSYNGWSIRLQGTPAPGDTLRIAPPANPAADNRNALAMQALGDAAFVDGARVVDRYAELIGDVGARAQSASAASELSGRLYDDAERARSSVSDVNLDEEAARMMQHQQAYQAAAKVLATANELFRSLLSAVGG
ncbi:MAG TPA: flagellar hook-associated protein FlgK [Burkholderiaceae bacterium]|nr:flagellar hook-associated protein FlgK [Burkholderiaceae bacterium]